MSGVRPGYKWTEVGAVPEDWEVRSLGELGRFKNGINKDNSAFGSGHPFVNLLDVFGRNTVPLPADLGLIKSTSTDRATYDLRRGDVLFVRSSVKPSGVGLTAVVEHDLPDTVFSGFLLRFRDGGRLDLRFKQHVFYAEKFRQELIGRSSVSANTNINQSALLGIKLPLPPTHREQQAVSEALGDADALIATLETLVAKKGDIKQGAMQELLTGHRRLTGYEGKWKKQRLDQLANIRSGGTPSTTKPEFWDGDIPWCTPTDITALSGRKYLTRTFDQISQLGLKNSSAEIVPINSVVMTSRATIGECAINKVTLATNQGFKNFIPLGETDVEFLYYQLGRKKSDFIALCGGSTFLEIGKKQLREFELEMPATLGEQQAIAMVLSDMDAEIFALEEKLAKARAVKQGMMQVLLTGEVRLV